MEWSVLEKEAFAILAKLERVYWLAETPSGFDFLTSHNNIVYIFVPWAFFLDLSAYFLLSLVLRWAVPFTIFNFISFQISSETPFWWFSSAVGRLLC